MTKKEAFKALCVKFEPAMSKNGNRVFIHRIHDNKWYIGGDVPSGVVCKDDKEFAFEVATRASLGQSVIRETIKAYRDAK